MASAVTFLGCFIRNSNFSRVTSSWCGSLKSGGEGGSQTPPPTESSKRMLRFWNTLCSSIRCLKRGRQPDTAAHRELEEDVEVLEDFVLLNQVPEEREAARHRRPQRARRGC